MCPELNAVVDCYKRQTPAYVPLQEPKPLVEQVWPDGTPPLVCTRTLTYNHKGFIRDCIEGILMQRTTFPVRVCVHDDASIDGTADIIREYQAKFPALIWAYFQTENSYRHPNKRAKRAEFSAWSRAGSYIALCEGDDYWTDPDKLEKQVRFLESNPDYVVAFHARDRLHADGTLERKSEAPEPWKRDLTARELACGAAIIPTLTRVYRNVLGELPPEQQQAPHGDRFMSARLGLHGGAKFMPEIGPAVYRVHSGGVWSGTSHDERRRNKFLTYWAIHAYFKRVGRHEYARAWERMLADQAVGLFSNRFLFLALVKRLGGRLRRKFGFLSGRTKPS